MQVDNCQLGQAPAAYFRAARGDHDAQAAMASLMIEQGLAGDVPLDAAITMALIWSHMATTSGKACHLLAYAGLLLAQASRAPVEVYESGAFDDYFATALAITDAVADAGHGRAEIIAFALASRVSPAVIAKAVEMKRQFEVAPLSDEDRQSDIAAMQGVVDALGADAMGSC